MTPEKIYNLVDNLEELFNILSEVKTELQEIAYDLTTEEEKQETNN